MRAFVFTDKALERYAGRFVWLSVDTENSKNADFLKKYPINVWPTLLVVDPVKERVSLRYAGCATVGQLSKLLDQAEGKTKSPAAARLARERPGVWALVRGGPAGGQRQARGAARIAGERDARGARRSEDRHVGRRSLRPLRVAPRRAQVDQGRGRGEEDRRAVGGVPRGRGGEGEDAGAARGVRLASPRRVHGARHGREGGADAAAVGARSPARLQPARAPRHGVSDA